MHFGKNLKRMGLCWLALLVVQFSSAIGVASDNFFDGHPHGPFHVDEQKLKRADAAIGPEPVTPEDAQKVMRAISLHPFCVEVQRRLAHYDCVSKFEKNPDGTSVRSPRNWSEAKYRDASGAWRAERAAEHRAAVARLLNPKAVASANERPKAFVLLGSPAAGKTSAASPLAKSLGCEFTTINDDDIAALLTGYEGWNATLLHVECAYVARELLARQALQLHHNQLFDITGADLLATARRVDQLADAGYEIHLCHVATPPEKCVWRAWNRFRINAFGPPDEDRGRFVDPNTIYFGMGRHAGETYEALKKKPAVVSWIQVLPQKPGEPPRILDQGQRSPSTDPAGKRLP